MGKTDGIRSGTATGRKQSYVKADRQVVNEIYNVGRMRQKKNTASSWGSSVREGGARTAALPNGKINNNDDVSVSDSSIAPDESLSNNLFDSLTPEQWAGGWSKHMLSDQGQQRAEKAVLCKSRPPSDHG